MMMIIDEKYATLITHSNHISPSLSIIFAVATFGAKLMLLGRETVATKFPKKFSGPSN